jgi:tetratricopeptide (TPR) repeat protein
VIALGRSTVERKQLSRGEGSAIVLPSPFLKIAALEFKGLVSDILFLDSIAFYGGTLNRAERPRVKEWEWQWLDKSLSASSDLDPYFLDPYLFGNAIFTWEAGMIREANDLLTKGSGHRTWDWMLPFFTGFNYFYFLQENEKAAEFLMEASRRPSADPMLASIASKLAFKERKTETSIQFLEEMLQRTDDELSKQRFRKRIEALRGILLLEQAVATYQKRYHVKPRSFEMLIAKGLIQNVPEDPYGGKFYLEPSGSVKSTTERELMPHRKK